MCRSEFSITTELLKEELKLRSAIRKWVSIKEDEADIFQETIATLIERNQQKKIKNPLAYAVTVARHYAWKLASRKCDSYEETLDTRETECVEDNFLQREKIAAIQEILNNMPPMRQQVFIRRRLHHQSREKIAKDLGLSEEAVKKHINRALAQLALHVD